MTYMMQTAYFECFDNIQRGLAVGARPLYNLYIFQ